MRKKTLSMALIVLAVTTFSLVPLQGDAQQAYPTKPVQLVVGSPGGSLDLLGRATEQVLTAEKMLDRPFIIQNKGAGGGNQSTAFIIEQKGNAYVIAYNSNRIILNYHVGTIEYGLKDVTTLACLTTEYPVWAVRADSKYKSAMEVLADIKKDFNSVVFGLTSLISNNQFNILLPAKAYGIDYTKIKLVALPSGGEIMTQLLGGHIPIISTGLAEILTHVNAGKMRVLSIASASRLDRLPGAPTWKDLGMDIVIPHWTGAFGPPDMPKAAYDYWNKKFTQMVQTRSWKDMLNKYDLNDAFLTGDEFKKQLVKDEATFIELLGATGQLKKK